MVSRNPTTPFDRANTKVADVVSDSFASTVMTPRRLRMCAAYVEKGTVSAAAKAAGMSPTVVKRLIETDEDVRNHIGKLVDRAAAVTGVTLERVLQEYARLAFSDIGELADLLNAAGQDSDVAMSILAELPADVTAAISEINITRKLESTKEGEEFVSGTMKLKLIDKKSALQDLGRMFTLFTDKIVVEDNSGFGDRLKRAVDKIEGLTTEEDTTDVKAD